MRTIESMTLLGQNFSENDRVVKIKRTDLGWADMPDHFSVVGIEGTFNRWSDLKYEDGRIIARKYRDNEGHEIQVWNH